MACKPGTKTTALLLEQSLYGRVAKTACEESRSVNQQIVYYIKQGISNQSNRKTVQNGAGTVIQSSFPVV